VTALEEWMSKGKAPALDYSLRLFNDIKSRGIQIILISGRREHLRSATIDNLVNVGYHGWTSLILRLVQHFNFNSPIPLFYISVLKITHEIKPVRSLSHGSIRIYS
jgi:hypothetical protein